MTAFDSYELRATSYELRATSYELRATSYELRATSYELRATSYVVSGRVAMGANGGRHDDSTVAPAEPYGTEPAARCGTGAGPPGGREGGREGGRACLRI
ncbi:hypothetical protein Acsp01_67170 [Actinoplanes sp. NBRC 101535]|nr:hypothetical protein Acsp01_67170 [Actinoplanes sp. NBRC 101535]